MGKSLGPIASIGITLAGIASGPAGWFSSAFFKQAGFMALGLLAQSSQKVKVGALQDQGIMVAAEGVELVRGYGTNRHSGTLVYTTNWIEHDSNAGGKGGPQSTSANYTTSYFIVGGQGPITRVNRIWLNSELVYDYLAPPPTMMLADTTPDEGAYFSGSFNGWGLRVYTGTLNQPVDTHIAGMEGTNNWTNYPGLWGIYIQDMQGGAFGNSMPNVTIEYFNENSLLSQVITEICERCGLLAGDLDLYALGALDTAPTSGEGYLIGSQKSGAEAIQELETMFNFVLVEEDGVLRAKMRGQTLAAALTDTDLRQHAGDEPTPGIRGAVADIEELPWTQEIQFMDMDRLENPGFRFFERGDVEIVAGSPVATRGLERASTTLGSAMAGNRAQRIAKIALGEKWNGRRTYPIAWGMKYCYLGAGDEITIPTPAGITRRVHLPKISYALFGANTCVAEEIDPLLYAIPLPAATSGLGAPTIVTLGDLIFVVWDGNSIQDADNGAPGAYLAVSKLQTATWNSVTVYSNLTNNELNGGPSNFQGMPRATVGTTTGTLGNYADTVYSFDLVNSITVNLAYGELDSVECEQLLDGATNGCMIGSEYLQFAKATLIANPDDPAGLWGGYSRYTLSHFIRGCRGTGAQIPLHAENEVFVLFTGALRRFTMAVGVIGYPVSFTVMDSGGAGSATANAGCTIIGANLMTYAPTNFAAAKQPNGDLLLTWTRRSRYSDPYYATGSDVPLGENIDPGLKEQYQIDVNDMAFSDSPYSPTSTIPLLYQTENMGGEILRGTAISYSLYQIGWPSALGYENSGTVVVG